MQHMDQLGGGRAQQQVCERPLRAEFEDERRQPDAHNRDRAEAPSRLDEAGHHAQPPKSISDAEIVMGKCLS